MVPSWLPLNTRSRSAVPISVAAAQIAVHVRVQHACQQGWTDAASCRTDISDAPVGASMSPLLGLCHDCLCWQYLGRVGVPTHDAAIEHDVARVEQIILVLQTVRHGVMPASWLSLMTLLG